MGNLKNMGIVLLIWFIKLIAANQLRSELDTSTSRLSEGPFIILGICSKWYQHYVFLIPISVTLHLLGFHKTKAIMSAPLWTCEHQSERACSARSEEQIFTKIVQAKLTSAMQ